LSWVFFKSPASLEITRILFGNGVLAQSGKALRAAVTANKTSAFVLKVTVPNSSPLAGFREVNFAMNICYFSIAMVFLAVAIQLNLAD